MDFIKVLRDNYNINLNNKQEEAVLNINGPSLLLSVPGGGKTTVIVSRCANMILNHKINPDKILTLTFSKASAKDMKMRYESLFNVNGESNLKFSTIHSFCYSVMSTYLRLANRPSPLLIEDDNSGISKTKLLKRIYLEKHKEYVSEDKLEEFSNSISFVKNMLIEAVDIKDEEYSVPNFKDMFETYEKHKRENKYIDYDDMLTGVYQLFCRNAEILKIFRDKYHFVNVDESQDTSLVQHEIIKLLAMPRNNIFMVGDEDQSIYSFRAAFPKALLDYEKTYPGAKVHFMERNYRTTGRIVQAANSFIKQNKERYPKNMFTQREEGGGIVFSNFKDKDLAFEYLIKSLQEVGKLQQTGQLNDIAILFRNNISAITIAYHLKNKMIPFRLREGNIHFFNHWLLRDISAFMKLSLDLTNVEAFGQIYYKMNGFITKNMFAYVVSKHSPNSSVFKTLTGCPLVYTSAQKSITTMIIDFENLGELNPLEAIDFIQEEMGYDKYLKRLSKENGYSKEGLNQVLDSLKAIAKDSKDVESFFANLKELQNFIENTKGRKDKNALTLSTIHGCKGLEFDRVYMIDIIDGLFPTAKSIGEAGAQNWSLMEEEIRLFYVGITRAKNNLELLSFDMVNGKKVKKSRFVKQLQKHQNNGIEREVEIGSSINHVRFGEGKALVVDGDTVEVVFEDYGRKILSIKTCIESGIISLAKG